MKTQQYMATVWWVSPQHGGLADLNKKMLSVSEDLVSDTGYVAFDKEHGEERYLFDSEHTALAFKACVEDGYAKEPEYNVIDDEGNTVLEDGKPRVAWKPEVEVKAAPDQDVEYYFSSYATKD